MLITDIQNIGINYLVKYIFNTFSNVIFFKNTNSYNEIKLHSFYEVNKTLTEGLTSIINS